jgi:histone acetyltransferase (RNA polymerase elongator complex component)
MPSPPPENAWRILERHPRPEPPRGPRRSVLPVFLPFAGCPQRCIFCDQTAQTGTPPAPLEALHARLAQSLAALPQTPGPARELAFYGGTFTALPEPWPRRFLELARPHLDAGRIARVRCSTRPDAVSVPLLAELKQLGLSLVELGVQSFDDAALAASQRGYTRAVARQGCEAVLAAGLSLGVQLMPGLPGQGPEAFRNDVETAACFRPEITRLYPCLVLEGTPLAALWRAGGYAPWPLAETVEALAAALPRLWAAGARTARIGLAEEPGLTVLAGPRHPALGQMARARALQLHVAGLLASRAAGAPRPDVLLLPRALRGEALGQKNVHASGYAELGLAVAFWDEGDLALAQGPAAGG